METKTFEFDKNKKRLTFFSNNKPIGGLIGRIAVKRHKELTRTFKTVFNGRSTN